MDKKDFNSMQTYPKPLTGKEAMELATACAAGAIVLVGFLYIAVMGIMHLVMCGG